MIGELLAADLLPHPNAMTANGKTIFENCAHHRSSNTDVIKIATAPMVQAAGFINLKGNLFDSYYENIGNFIRISQPLSL